MGWMRTGTPFMSIGLGLSLCLSTLDAGAAAKDPMAVAFGTMPTLWNVRISPDGSKILFLQMHDQDIPVAIAFDFTDGKMNLLLASEKDRFDLSWCDWANNERILCGYYAINRDSHHLIPVTRLVSVNADGSGQKVLLQKRLERTFTQFQDRIIDWLPDDPEHVLVIKPDAIGSGVSRLNVYSGDIGTEASVRSAAYGWMTDGRGNLRVRFLMGKYDYRWQYRDAGETAWRILEKWDHEDIDVLYEPIGFADDPNLLLVLKTHEGHAALWREDLANDRKSELVFSHPDVDVGGALRLGKFRRMVAVEYSTERNHLHYFDDTIEKISEKITAAFPDHAVQIVDESWDRKAYIALVSSDLDPGAYYRFDAETNKLTRISPQYSKLEGISLSPMKPMSYEARDGTRIQGYLTLPISPPEGGMPAIVFPHGGPHSRDYWGYDWLAQFFSARGYAVLQSNFRGSGGFGGEWLGEGGFRNWRTAIDDITDGAHHLVESGIADPKRLCIVGWSYGGYAALLSAVEEPALYRCVVSIAGVTDLPMLIEERKEFLGWRGEKEYIGRDSDVLDSGSPARRASEITAPVLLFHGEEDINVQIGHSEKMAKALKKKKKDVKLVEYKEAEHSIRRNEYRIDMLDRIGTFLDRNSGPDNVAP